jgi:quinoprotein glucose dehydrogenase
MNKMRRPSFIIATMALLIVSAIVSFKVGTFREALPSDDWLHYGYDPANTKFSPLKTINLSNVKKLKVAWHFRENEVASSIYFNPLIIKGKMIVLMPSNKLVALDAARGRKLWEFKPDSSDVLNWTKGMTFRKGENGRPDALYFVSGSTLYALNTNTGRLIPTFGNKGKVDFYEGLPVSESMRSRIAVTSNASGVIYNDLFIIGCKVPDELPSVAGDIRAFNANTGKLEWIFHTIPEKGEYGAETWPEGARNKNGGANCWGGMALDEKRGIVYVPTGSPSFDFYGADREGQNLFANCIIALDAKSGKRIWHFQTTHHDLWDRDNGSPPNLVTVDHDGRKIDGVALVTKLGYVFLFDRETGKPLFPINEIPVPTKSVMPGEKPWPTQPFPEKPAPFARQGYRKDYFNDITPELKAHFSKELNEKNYNTGIYDPPDLNGSVIVPAAHGGANWGGAAYNPGTGVLFVNSTDLPWFLKLKEMKGLVADNNKTGEALFKMYCSSCHGMDKKGTNAGPSIFEKLRQYPSMKLDALIKKGAEPMPSFKHLPQQQINAIVAYLKDIPVKNLNGKIENEQTTSEPYAFSGYDFYADVNRFSGLKPPYGTLNAIDLNKGVILWQVPLGEDKRLAQMGIKKSGMYNRGGCIATAGGLVFIAATADQKFRAFDQQTGEVVWEADLPGSGYAIPSTYAVGKQQFVTIAVSPNSATGYKGGYMTFSMD